MLRITKSSKNRTVNSKREFIDDVVKHTLFETLSNKAAPLNDLDELFRIVEYLCRLQGLQLERL